MTDAVAIPGVGRTISFKIVGADGNEHTFGFRRPSRADVRDAATRAALKLTLLSGPRTFESNYLDTRDGYNVEWESRLEVGLVPRKARSGELMALGEGAPSHWLQGGAVSFDAVDDDEFQAVVRHLEQELAKKKPAQTSENSTASAAQPG